MALMGSGDVTTLEESLLEKLKNEKAAGGGDRVVD